MHLAQYFVRAVKRFPEATAVVDDQVRWSYRDLYEEVATVAANVQHSGVKRGDHALVVLRNHRENLVIYWTCQLLGLIYTPVNFRMSLAELVYCIGDAEPVLVFYEEENRATIKLHSNERTAQPGFVLLLQVLAQIPSSNCGNVEHPCKRRRLFPRMISPSCSTPREQQGVLKVCLVLTSMKRVLLRLILFRTSMRSLRVRLVRCRSIIRWACARCW